MVGSRPSRLGCRLTTPHTPLSPPVNPRRFSRRGTPAPVILRMRGTTPTFPDWRMGTAPGFPAVNLRAVGVRGQRWMRRTPDGGSRTPSYRLFTFCARETQTGCRICGSPLFIPYFHVPPQRNIAFGAEGGGALMRMGAISAPLHRKRVLTK